MAANRVIIRTEFGSRITTIDVKTKEVVDEILPITTPDELLTKWVNDNNLTVLGMALSAPKMKNITSRVDREKGHKVLRTEYSMAIWVSAAEVPQYTQSAPPPQPTPSQPAPNQMYDANQVNQMIAAAKAEANNVASRFQQPQGNPPQQ